MCDGFLVTVSNSRKQAGRKSHRLVFHLRRKDKVEELWYSEDSSNRISSLPLSYPFLCRHVSSLFWNDWLRGPPPFPETPETEYSTYLFPQWTRHPESPSHSDYLCRTVRCFIGRWSFLTHLNRHLLRSPLVLPNLGYGNTRLEDVLGDWGVSLFDTL